MVESPRSGQLTYPENLRVVGGSLLDIHRATSKRERWLETCCIHASIRFQSQKKSATRLGAIGER
jgi:hypothetical protein